MWGRPSGPKEAHTQSCNSLKSKHQIYEASIYLQEKIGLDLESSKKNNKEKPLQSERSFKGWKGGQGMGI